MILAIDGDAAPRKPGNPLQGRCGALVDARGAGRSSSGARPSPRRCRMHGGVGGGRPATSGNYTQVAESNNERLRILLFLLQELNPDVEPSGWFRPPRGDRDPVKLIEKYRRLTRQVEAASRPRKRRQR